MKALILAAGYGTRLEAAIRNHPTSEFSHLIGVPKPLLPVGRIPLASHWLQAISRIEEIDQVYVVVSLLFD